MQAQVREYKYADREGCLLAFKSNVPLYFTELEISEFEFFLETFQEKAGGNKTHFYVVDFDEMIIGCGGFGDKDNTNRISLAWGLIHQDFHKKGFGELLLTGRLSQIKTRYPDASVSIDTTQFSVGFYEKFGFVVTKVTNDFYAKGMHRYDLLYTPEEGV